jgi:alpha-tubulin suppressor-like RCC1 family protein
MTRTLLLTSLLAAGCGNGAYDVRVQFDPATLADAADVVELFVVENCAEQDDRGGPPVGSVLRSVVARRSETALPMGSLPPGDYGLYGLARGSDCVVVAAGCEDISVAARGSGQLEVTLTPVDDGGGCPPTSTCASGLCIAPDAGRDGGGDAGSDAGFDAGPEVPCTDGEACVRSGAPGICYGTSCCTGCWTGTDCAAGTASEACGEGGGECTACACPQNGCSAGACIIPVEVAAIDAGDDFNCALARDGALYCWGHNSFGQLGVGDAGEGTERLRPVRVGTLTEWMDVMLGDDTACAWHVDRTAWCWGDNTDGQLGIGDRVTRAVPQRGPMTAWATYVYGENDHACGLMDDDTLWCWGENDYGQLALGNTTDQVSPVQIGTATWLVASPGGDHTCAIRSDGLLFCSGQNADGELGVGDIMPRDVFTQVGTATWDRLWPGLDYHCGRQTGGDVYCWGANGNGQLGQDNQTDQLAPVVMDPATEWEQIGGGELHNCGRRSDGAIWCWGLNEHGQALTGTAGGHVLVPTQVGTRTDWTDIGVGAQHTCALRADGTVWCAGRNHYGQLGVGDRTDRAELAAVCF